MSKPNVKKALMDIGRAIARWFQSRSDRPKNGPVVPDPPAPVPPPPPVVVEPTPPPPVPIVRPEAVIRGVGASDYFAIGDPRVDIPAFAAALGDLGMRHTRVWLLDAWATGPTGPGTYDGYLPVVKLEDGRYNLFGWRQDYFQRVWQFANEMNRHGIVPVFTLLELYTWSRGKQGLLWVPDAELGPWRNNVNGVRWGDPDDPTFFSLPDEWMHEFVARVLQALGSTSYVIETGNEMPEKEMHMRLSGLIPESVRVQTNRQEDTPGQYFNMMRTGLFDYVALHGKRDLGYLDEDFPREPKHRTFRSMWADPDVNKARLVLSSDGCRKTVNVDDAYDYAALTQVAHHALAQGAAYEHQLAIKLRRFTHGRYDLSDISFDTPFLRGLTGA